MISYYFVLRSAEETGALMSQTGALPVPVPMSF